MYVVSASCLFSKTIFCNLFVSAREWWQFAATCILESIRERNMRQTWSFVVKRAHDVVKYVNIYSQYLISGSVEPLLKVCHCKHNT